MNAIETKNDGGAGVAAASRRVGMSEGPARSNAVADKLFDLLSLGKTALVLP